MPISGLRGRFSALFITIAFVNACPASLAAQTAGAGWQTISQPGGYLVARVSGNGLADGIGLTCERGVPVLAVNLQRPVPTNAVRVTLDIDQDSYPVTLVRNGRTNVWVAAMRDVTPIDALAKGSGATLTASGQTVGTFPLAGARAAITRALAACYSPPGPQSDQAIIHAAPVSKAFGGVTAGAGCPAAGPVARWGAVNVPDYNGNTLFCGDFTGDGAADAFAILHYDFPGGNAQGQEAALFANVGGQLRFLRRVPQFYGQTEAARFAAGRVTLDMTVMLPTDSRCCPSGKEIRQIDTASGRHWQLVDDKPPAIAAIPTGPLSKLPIALGPYVGVAETCRAPSQVTWFEPSGYWEISRDSRFFSEIAKITRDGADFLLFAKPGPSDPPPDPAYPDDSAVGVRPTGPGRIVMMVQDDMPMKLCKAEEIPARFRP